MPDEREYVLGTTDEEVARLGLQHRVWRPRVLDAWRRAGFTAGQTLLDVGCGPGYATCDLAEIVGGTGRVVALDQSARFLRTLLSACASRGLGQVVTHELNLNQEEIPVREADGAWCRWVLCFVHRPREVLARIAGAIRPGGVLVLHEYFDYATWRLAPRSEPIEEFVATVMETWRDNGGEPDIGLDLPGWLSQLGFTLLEIRPILDVVSRTDPIWEWPAAFLEVNLGRLVSTGRLTEDRAELTRTAFREASERPGTYMITPAVIEIIARRM